MASGPAIRQRRARQRHGHLHGRALRLGPVKPIARHGLVCLRLHAVGAIARPGVVVEAKLLWEVRPRLRRVLLLPNPARVRVHAAAERELFLVAPVCVHQPRHDAHFLVVDAISVRGNLVQVLLPVHAIGQLVVALEPVVALRVHRSPPHLRVIQHVAVLVDGEVGVHAKVVRKQLLPLRLRRIVAEPSAAALQQA